MMDINELFKIAVQKNASDIFLIPGMPFTYKIDGNIIKYNEIILKTTDIKDIVDQIYNCESGRSISTLEKRGDDDFSFSILGMSRFRASVFKQRGSMAVVIRVITFKLPNPDELHLNDTIMDVCNLKKGLVLVTGPAGSGKSTTLACIIDRINSTRNAHVITLEDPIEYLHKHKKSIVTQREVYLDTESYATGLRAALRQAPDVILIGEMRDYETMRIAMTAAETGHLVISTLHTIGAVNTINRIIDSFPPEQQAQIKIQISMVLEMVVTQQIVLSVDTKLIPAFEIMKLNSAIRNMIRESKVHQINGIIAASRNQGMISMDDSLFQLLENGVISTETALTYSQDRDIMSNKISRL